MDDRDEIKVHAVTPIKPIAPISHNLIAYLPENFTKLKPKAQIQGLIISIDKQQVVVETALGEVILKTKLNYQVGNKLALEPYINGDSVRLKIYDLSINPSNAKAVSFKLPRKKLKNDTSQLQYEQAFNIDNTPDFIEAILVNKKDFNLLTSNPRVMSSIRSHLPKNLVNLESSVLEGSNFKFKLLTINTLEEAFIDVCSEGKVIFSCKISADERFGEAILECPIGDFTFSNIDANLEDNDFLSLELNSITLSASPYSQALKLDSLSEILCFIESLDGKPIGELEPNNNSLNIFNLDLKNNNDMLAINLAQILMLNYKSPIIQSDKTLFMHIQIAIQSLYKASLSMQWQIQVAPIIYQGKLYIIKFFTKQGDDDNTERFIIELNDLIWEKIVIEGLLIEHSEGKHLFLKIKSPHILDKEFEQSIIHFLSLTSQAQGLKVNITFSSLEEYTSPLIESIRSLNSAQVKGYSD